MRRKGPHRKMAARLGEIMLRSQKARDQVIAKLKRLDSEIRVALTDIWFENDYSTLRASRLGEYFAENVLKSSEVVSKVVIWHPPCTSTNGQGSRVRLMDGADQIKVFLRKILEAGDDGGVTAVRKAIDLYSSCINTALIDEIGAAPLIKLLNQTGGWSLIGLEESEPWSINSTTGFIYEKIHGSFALFEISFGFDSMNSSKWMPTISQGDDTVDYTNNDTLNAYQNFIVSILSLLHPTGDQNTFKEAAENIISFETELSKIRLSPTALRDVVATYNLFSVRDLPTLWSDFDWQAFVDAMYNLTGFTASADLQFIVTTPSYFQNLSRIIQSTNDS